MENTMSAETKWQRDIAMAGLSIITKDREYALVLMDGKGRLSVWDKTYSDRRIAIGQATRLENLSRGDNFTRGYAVVKFGDKVVVYIDTNTVLYHGPVA